MSPYRLIRNESDVIKSFSIHTEIINSPEVSAKIDTPIEQIPLLPKERTID